MSKKKAKFQSWHNGFNKYAQYDERGKMISTSTRPVKGVPVRGHEPGRIGTQPGGKTGEIFRGQKTDANYFKGE